MEYLQKNKSISAKRSDTIDNYTFTAAKQWVTVTQAAKCYNANKAQHSDLY